MPQYLHCMRCLVNNSINRWWYSYEILKLLFGWWVWGGGGITSINIEVSYPQFNLSRRHCHILQMSVIGTGWDGGG